MLVYKYKLSDTYKESDIWPENRWVGSSTLSPGTIKTGAYGIGRSPCFGFLFTLFEALRSYWTMVLPNCTELTSGGFKNSVGATLTGFLPILIFYQAHHF